MGAYERNAQMPGSTFIIAICECYNIEPRWLLTGVGPMRPGAEAAHAASDTLPSPAALPGVVEAGCARCLKLEEKLNRTSSSVTMPWNSFAKSGMKTADSGGRMRICVNAWPVWKSVLSAKGLWTFLNEPVEAARRKRLL